MGDKYVDAQDFNDFKGNFNTMVGVFNHRVSEIANNSKATAKSVKMIGKEFGNLKTDIAVVKEKTKNNNWMIKWIFGVIAALVIGGIVSMYS